MVKPDAGNALTLPKFVRNTVHRELRQADDARVGPCPGTLAGLPLVVSCGVEIDLTKGCRRRIASELGVATRRWPGGATREPL